MAQLAIKGHATRGREVIELLEMLGGINEDEHKGFMASVYYFINDNYIDWCHECTPESEFICFSLEEFLEKFPYKVGDKVTHNAGILMNVVRMYWDSGCNVVRYDIQSPVDNNYKLKAMLAEHLRPYKEETMEEKDEKSVNHVFSTAIISFDIAQGDKYELDLQGKFHVVLREGKYYVERIKPQYPKTYVECAKILNCFGAAHIDGYKSELLEKFQELLICRDAYWKIAGEQMGLGKPWEPDWESDKDIYTIEGYSGTIGKDITCRFHRIFAFPTEEMRDAFKENFDKDLEFCKELL